MIRYGNGHGHDGRIIVHEIEEALCADDETSHYDLARVQGLFPAGDHAQLGELCYGIAQNLCMDTQILLIVQEIGHRIGDATDA